MLLSGFCPSDDVERAQADMIFDAVVDLRTSYLKLRFEKDEGKKVGKPPVYMYSCM